MNDNFFRIHWEMVTSTYTSQSGMREGSNDKFSLKNVFLVAVLLLYFTLVILKHQYKIINHNSQVESVKGKYVTLGNK